MCRAITDLAEAEKEKLVGFLRDLVAIPSLSGDEAAVIKRIHTEMENIGFDEIRTDSMGNLIGRLGRGKRILAIDGHCDTVAAGNTENWDVDPFAGQINRGIVYGRGASDQKGGLAAAVYAGKLLKKIGIPPDTSIYVVASVLEEDMEGICWKHLIESENIRPDAVLLTEPTNLTIATGQRGRMEIRVETSGISCHGSAPDNGVNAIYRTAPIIGEVEQLNKSLQSRSILGKGTIAVTKMDSSAPSLCAVPDAAYLHLDRRTTEGETQESCLSEITNLSTVRQAAARVSIPEYRVKSYTGYEFPVKAYYPMWLMPVDHPLVVSALRTAKEQLSLTPETTVWGFSTNGVATMGEYGIPSIGFGPGREDHAHTSRDQIKVDDLLVAAAFYAAFARSWSTG